MTRCVLMAAILLSAGGGIATAAFADEVPKSWSKSMTSDPATNHALERYTRPLPDKAQTTTRAIMLFRLLSVGCADVTSDKRKVDAYAEASGLFALPAEDRKIASRFASAEFDAFDYDGLAHLCAGSDYLFGRHGVLIADAMTKGSGKVKFRYDPANPYLPVRPFLPE